MVLKIVRRLSLGSGSVIKKSAGVEKAPNRKGSPKQNHKSKKPHPASNQLPQKQDSVPSADAVSQKMRKKLQKLDKALMMSMESPKQTKARAVKRDNSSSTSTASSTISKESPAPVSFEPPRNRRVLESNLSVRSIQSTGANSCDAHPMNENVDYSLDSESESESDSSTSEEESNKSQSKQQQMQSPTRPSNRPRLDAAGGTGLFPKQSSQRSLLAMCGTTANRRFSMGSVGTFDSRDRLADDLPDFVQHDTSSRNGDAVNEPNFEHIMSIVNSWQLLKNVPDYEEILAEQILLKMFELDATVRQDLELPSLRSDKFHQVKEKLMSVVDGLLSFLGPNLDDSTEQIQELGHRYRCDGFKEYLLAPAVTEGIKYLFSLQNDATEDDVVFSSAMEHGWNDVMEFLVCKMY